MFDINEVTSAIYMIYLQGVQCKRILHCMWCRGGILARYFNNHVSVKCTLLQSHGIVENMFGIIFKYGCGFIGLQSFYAIEKLEV